MSYYAIAAAEDCSKSLDTYVNSDVLDAIQRSASKPWVSETPYATNSCMPDLSLVLIDSRKLEKDFLEAFLWWSKVLNWSERFVALLFFCITNYDFIVIKCTYWFIAGAAEEILPFHWHSTTDTSSSLVHGWSETRCHCYSTRVLLLVMMGLRLSALSLVIVPPQNQVMAISGQCTFPQHQIELSVTKKTSPAYWFQKLEVGIKF